METSEFANGAVWVVEGLMVVFILCAIFFARRGKNLYIRKIPGLNVLDEAVGRATEMGRPILFAPGITGLDIVSLQAMSVLSHVAKLASRYETRVIVPVCDPLLYTVADEVLRDTYATQGMPEQFNEDDIRYLSDMQFAWASGVVGILHREQVAGAIYFGNFFAESLILAENGQMVGAIQIAGTPQTTQVPFFLAACDYTIIGDEYYAASAYISREPTLLGSLVGQDYSKLLMVVIVIVGIALVTVMKFVPESHWGHLLRNIGQQYFLRFFGV
jgi:hypothetical protein